MAVEIKTLDRSKYSFEIKWNILQANLIIFNSTTEARQLPIYLKKKQRTRSKRKWSEGKGAAKSTQMPRRRTLLLFHEMLVTYPIRAIFETKTYET